MSQNSDAGSFPSVASQARREVFGEPLIGLVSVSFVFFLIAVGLVSVVALRAPQLSPFDEATHADYAYQISHGHVPAKGSTLGSGDPETVVLPRLLRRQPTAALRRPRN